MKQSISQSLLPRRVVEIGQIKIGGQSTGKKRGGGKPPPVKYDHFEVVTRERDVEGRLIPEGAITEKLGAKPKELDIRLMYGTPEENFLSRMNQYDGQTLLRECDGEQREDRSTGECGECLRALGCECKPYGRLKVILEAADTFGGLYGFRTGSWETIRNIQSALEFFHEAFGTLRGLRLKMALYKATDEVDGKRFTNWKVGLVLRESFEDAAKMALEYHKVDQLTRGQLRALASGSEESFEAHDQEDEEEIADEFYPPEEPRPEDESQEDEPDQAPDEELPKLRAQYHAKLSELIPGARAREDSRHAFHHVHRDLPASETDWKAGHYTQALIDINRFGKEVLEKAVARFAELEPAAEEEIEELKSAIDASGISAEEAEKIWWVINSGVRPWVSREIQRLKLNGVEPSDEVEDEEQQPTAQASFV